MAVRKICKPKGCRGSPRCDHPWWFDVMHDGKRWRMRVDDFAIARGATEPVTSKQTAERVWEPKFLGEIMAGRDPRIPPTKPAPAGDADGRGVPRSVLHELRRGGRPQERRHGQRASESAQGFARGTAGGRLEKPGEIVRFKATYRHGPRSGDGQPGARRASRGDQLGTIPGPAAALDNAVPSFRREHQSHETKRNAIGASIATRSRRCWPRV